MVWITHGIPLPAPLSLLFQLLKHPPSHCPCLPCHPSSLSHIFHKACGADAVKLEKALHLSIASGLAECLARYKVGREHHITQQDARTSHHHLKWWGQQRLILAKATALQREVWEHIWPGASGEWRADADGSPKWVWAETSQLSPGPASHLEGTSEPHRTSQCGVSHVSWA